MKQIRVEVDGKFLPVWFLRTSKGLWYHFDGESHFEETQRRAGKSGGGAKKIHPDKCLAPMPGKVLKVFVKKGDKVKEGELLIALEAMKMEYSLAAEMDGQVFEVLVKETEQVTLGQILVNLREEENSGEHH